MVLAAAALAAFGVSLINFADGGSVDAQSGSHIPRVLAGIWRVYSPGCGPGLSSAVPVPHPTGGNHLCCRFRDRLSTGPRVG